MTHNIKIEPQYFQAVIEGEKPFEIRLNGRNYQVGDTLILNEIGTGEKLKAKISYVTDYQQKENYVEFVMVGIHLIHWDKL